MKLSQKQRCLKAMMEGKTVSRLWAAKQKPIIAQPTNRCNELLRSGIPVQKIMMYPSKGSHYMAFFLTMDFINSKRK